MNQLSPTSDASAEQRTLDTLRLIRSENVGPITFHNLISYYGSVSEAIYHVPELAKRGGRKRPIRLCDEATAIAEIDKAHSYGATLLCYGDDDYPDRLNHIPDAPPVLAALGKPALWQQRRIIGMVGARNASANACAFAKKIASQLGERNIVVSSGLARGVDTAAHHGSLGSGTVAVIAGGIDHIYPPENESLYKSIAEQGCILAEAPFGSAPQARHFPARNRIIAGMSVGLVVIEASQKSGSLITANNALDYGREVFAVPGSPLDPRCKGSNDLIRKGATLTEGIDDIINQLESPAQLQLEEPNIRAFPSAMGDAKIDDVTLENARTLLMQKLGAEPVLLDELLAQCDITAHIMHIILLELELAGRLERQAGGRISLNIQPD